MTGFTPICSLMEETKSSDILAVSFGNCSPNTFVWPKDWKGMFYLPNWKYEVLLLLLLHWLKIRTETETETLSRLVETSGLSANQTCSWKAANFFFSGVPLMKGREPAWVRVYLSAENLFGKLWGISFNRESLCISGILFIVLKIFNIEQQHILQTPFFLLLCLFGGIEIVYGRQWKNLGTTLKGSLSSKQMKKACKIDLQLRGSL